MLNTHLKIKDAFIFIYLFCYQVLSQFAPPPSPLARSCSPNTSTDMKAKQVLALNRLGERIYNSRLCAPPSPLNRREPPNPLQMETTNL